MSDCNPAGNSKCSRGRRKRRPKTRSESFDERLFAPIARRAIIDLAAPKGLGDNFLAPTSKTCSRGKIYRNWRRLPLASFRAVSRVFSRDRVAFAPHHFFFLLWPYILSHRRSASRIVLVYTPGPTAWPFYAWHVSLVALCNVRVPNSTRAP